MIIEVGEHRFKSKSALLKELRALLYKHKPGTTFSDVDAAFLTACLEQANSFYSYPVETPTSWRVMTSLQWRNNEFVFSREDGTQENPSIKRLALTKSRAGKTPRRAARRDIADQIKNFRNNAGLSFGYQCKSCVFTSHNVGDFHVHHAEVPFTEMFENFLSHCGFIESDINVVEYLDDTGRLINFGMSEPAKTAFSDFHKKHANLELLCLKCHLWETQNG